MEIKRSEKIKMAIDDMNEYLVAEAGVNVEELDNMTPKEKLDKYLSTYSKFDSESVLWAVAGTYKILIKP